MKPTPIYEQVPLDEADKELLRENFKNGIWNIIVSYLFAISMISFNKFTLWLTAFLREIPAVNDWVEAHETGHNEFFMAALPGAILFTVWMSLIFIFVLFGEVWPYKTDLDNGFKYKVPYVIVSKKYFDISNQFFFGLDDPKYPNHQVDEDIFNECERGDTIYLYRAPVSGGIFQMNGTFQP